MANRGFRGRAIWDAVLCTDGVGDAGVMAHRRTPFTTGSEKQILLDFLDYLRGSPTGGGGGHGPALSVRTPKKTRTPEDRATRTIS